MIPSTILERPGSIGESGKKSIFKPNKPGNLHNGEPNYPPIPI